MRQNQSIENFTFCFRSFPFKNKHEDAGTEHQSSAAFSLTRVHTVIDKMRFSCFLLLGNDSDSNNNMSRNSSFSLKLNFTFNYALMNWKLGPRLERNETQTFYASVWSKNPNIWAENASSAWRASNFVYKIQRKKSTLLETVRTTQTKRNEINQYEK